VPGSVFLNCPFDAQYEPIFNALLFAVHACGFELRCAKEASGTESVRIEKIIDIIGECEFGIHDLSRVDTLGTLPRFNMALELGIFMGARAFGGKSHKKKKFYVFEGTPHQYHRIISDISGQDAGCHNNTPEDAVNLIRQWLSDQVSTKPGVPGKDRIMLLYGQFRTVLPSALQLSGQDEGSMTFRERRDRVQDFINLQVKPTPSSP
jgi:hypothetical protein